jgi:hypothetical protein
MRNILTPTRALICASTVMALGIISGCTSTKIVDQPSDQPLDQILALVGKEGIFSCLEHKAEIDTTRFADSTARAGLRELKVNQSCWLIIQPQVRPRRPNDPPTADELRYFKPHIGNGSGLYLSKDQTYKVCIPHGSDFSWYDLDRKVTKPEGDKGGRLTRHLSFMKLHKEQDWFHLNATTDNRVSEHPVSALTPLTGLEGELTFYVNDAPDEGKYDNNLGRILIVIHRTK